jgi:hypothetical protein
MGGKGTPKNAKAAGGIISSSSEQMSLLLPLDSQNLPLVAECSLCSPTASVIFLECRFTHVVAQVVETGAFRRLDKNIRMTTVPFSFDPSLLTCDDALKSHGDSQ